LIKIPEGKTLKAFIPFRMPFVTWNIPRFLLTPHP